jgi:hypothetical protein
MDLILKNLQSDSLDCGRNYGLNILLHFDFMRLAALQETIVSIETTVTLFKDTTTSRQVLKELYDAGFRNEFWIFGDSSEVWGNEAAGTNPMESSKHQYGGETTEVGILNRLGVPEDEAEAYMNDVRQGAVLVIGQVNDDRAQEVRDILGRHDPVRGSRPAG